MRVRIKKTISINVLLNFVIFLHSISVMCYPRTNARINVTAQSLFTEPQGLYENDVVSKVAAHGRTAG